MCVGYAGSLYAGVQQQMIASSPEFSPLLPSSSSSWSSRDDSARVDAAGRLVDRVKSEEVRRHSLVSASSTINIRHVYDLIVTTRQAAHVHIPYAPSNSASYPQWDGKCAG